MVIDQAIRELITKATNTSLYGFNKSGRPENFLDSGSQARFLKPSPTPSRKASPSPSREGRRTPKLPRKQLNDEPAKRREVPDPVQSSSPPDPDSEEEIYDQIASNSPIHMNRSKSPAPVEGIYDLPKLVMKHASLDDWNKRPIIPKASPSKSKSMDPQKSRYIPIDIHLRHQSAPVPTASARPLDERHPILDFESHRRLIANEPWYFGEMSSQEAAKLMNNTGDFLVRESSRNKGQFVLTVRNAEHVIHLNLLDDDGSIKNETWSFRNVKEFIDYHIRSKDNIANKNNEKYFLGQPVKKP